MKKLLIIVSALVLMGVGCNSDEAPIDVPVKELVAEQEIAEKEVMPNIVCRYKSGYGEIKIDYQYKICQNGKCEMFNTWYGSGKTGCLDATRGNYTKHFCGTYSMEMVTSARKF